MTDSHPLIGGWSRYKNIASDHNVEPNIFNIPLNSPSKADLLQFPLKGGKGECQEVKNVAALFYCLLIGYKT